MAVGLLDVSSVTAAVANNRIVQQICRINVTPVTPQPPDLELYSITGHPSSGNLGETNVYTLARLHCGECFRDDVNF